MACGLLWALRLALASHGVLHADALTHFLISRAAWHRPTLILDHWGRPVDTLLYMVPALFELVYARLASLTFAALTALMAFILAKQLRVTYAFVVPALLWFQPWFLRWSGQPSMTEIPFSLLMVLSASLFVSNRVMLASAVIGLFPLVRMEALALTGLWVALCVWRRAWLGALVASLPIVVYGVLSYAVFGQLPEGDMPLNPFLMLSGHVPHVHHPSPWRITYWLAYPRLLVSGAGLPLAALALCGVPRLMAAPARMAVLVWYGIYAAEHVALFRLVITDAEDRFWLPLAPLVGIASALGLEVLAGHVRSWIAPRQGGGARAVGFTELLVAVMLMIVVARGLWVAPVPAGAEEGTARAAVTWLRQERLTDPPIFSTASVWVFYYLPGTFRWGVWPDTARASDWPPGSIAVWDSGLSDDYGIPWGALSSNPKWKLLKTFERDKARIVIFRKELP